jgi:signal transduction histidine kinase
LSTDITAVPHPVKIDAGQMRRVLLNLTENAVKYAETKPLSISITIWREQGMEHLQFADNGQGVPESQLPHIFERFWRGDEARSPKDNDGSGLGLYIVKYIIEAHGGFVTAKNDHGLVIEMRLPCEKEETVE